MRTYVVRISVLTLSVEMNVYTGHRNVFIIVVFTLVVWEPVCPGLGVTVENDPVKRKPNAIID